MKGRLVRALILGLIVATMGLFSIAAMADEAPRMTTEKLKAILGDPDLVILDVRRHGDWESSRRKIAGAVREDPGEFESWANTYSKDKTLVLYCA
jgi:predicted sulfurtransferase